MPLFFQQNIDGNGSLAVWKITESESFFLQQRLGLRDIRHPQKRLQHAAGRYLLRWMDPAFPVDQIVSNPAEKPYLPDAAYQFSISHSGKYAASILSSEIPVGIDVECFSPKVMKVLHKFLSAEEQEKLLQSHAVPFLLETLCWSTKEALFKWHGKGDIDFKEDIRIAEITKKDAESYMLSVLFRDKPLTVWGKVFPECCLAWVAEK
jgi:phosphopantetheinyl transferase